ncbi:MAG: biotin/lipoate A/B protein ligase family protein [Planctomycetia bacterium]
MNTITIWWDAAADGPVNMAADECLAAEAERRGGLLLRFYRWSTTTISLGGFQRIDDARRLDAIRGIPLVRRPSGGGAIVHGSDLTYAAAVPKTHPWGTSPQVFYDALHGAMVDVLADRGIRAWPHAIAGREPSPEGGPRNDAAEPPFFCFDRRATGDLLMAGPTENRGSKIMGSAQRRLAGAVLQHGSLLLEPNTAVSGPARHTAVADLVDRSRVSDQAGLAGAWGRRIAHALEGTIREETAPFEVGRAAISAALAERFREERWTARR